MVISANSKKTVLSTAIALCLYAGGQQVVQAGTTLVFADNVSPLDPYPGINPLQRDVFSTFNEFRVRLDDTTSGGGEKSVVGDSKISGAGKATALPHDFVTWQFDDAGDFSSVSNSDMTPGAHYYAAGCGYITGTCTNQSPAPDGDVGMFLNAAFLGSPFGFLAPITGSAAAAQYGVGTISFSDPNFTVNIPVAEAQWSEGYFTLGQVEGGINFNGVITNGHDFRLTGDQLIDASEDSLGFSGQYTQWDLVGSFNRDPEASGVVLSTAPATPLVIPIANIATDPDGDGLSIQTINPVVSGAAGGTATCSASSCTYTPAATGPGNFMVTVDDNYAAILGSTSIQVSVNVTAGPTAVDDTATVDQSSTGNLIDLTANDVPGGNPINDASIAITTNPVNGSISTPLPGDGTALYSPNAGFVGVDTFSYTVDDTVAATSNTATATVTVNCIAAACSADGPVTAGSLGSVRVTEANLISAGLPADDGEGGVAQTCVPDCFSFIAPVVAPAPAQVVFTLSAALQADSRYRKFINGQWTIFDTATGDSVLSAPGSLGNCPPPGDSAYGPLAAGHFCLQLTISDGGPNDDDNIVGQITDPGGVGVGTAAGVSFPPQKLGGAGGCTLAKQSVEVASRSDWWVLFGFLTLVWKFRKVRAVKSGS